MDTIKSYIPKLHIMPPQGWLNDPNGLCQKDGLYHIFFQYSPDTPLGGLKSWGQYITKDFLTYEYTGEYMKPDIAEDKDGVYSGCGYVHGDEIYTYYTGNVKMEGDYDYIYKGRGHNVILSRTKDGIHYDEKKVLLTNSDYPSNLSCHVRDPKVFEYDGRYYMVLGARTNDDIGCVMIYSSEDMLNWKFERFVDSANRFGFMWECPDLFTLADKHILSFSPQGLDAEEYRYQNLFQSGYIVLDDMPWDLSCKGLFANMKVADTSYVVDESRFVEWDMGFDFYAPQSFVDEKGRTILIGWMGIPGADYDHDPSIDEGWQHMLTLPRVLTYDDALGTVRQNPVEEILELRDGVIAGNMDGNYEVPEIYELVGKTPNGFFEITFDHSLVFRASENDITLAFAGDTGYGRSIRKIKMPCQVQNVRIIVDVSAVEIYINDGQYVMTTKHYPKKDIAREVKVTGDMDLTCYKLKSMEFIF